MSVWPCLAQVDFRVARDFCTFVLPSSLPPCSLHPRASLFLPSFLARSISPDPLAPPVLFFLPTAYSPSPSLPHHLVVTQRYPQQAQPATPQDAAPTARDEAACQDDQIQSLEGWVVRCRQGSRARSGGALICVHSDASPSPISYVSLAINSIFLFLSTATGWQCPVKGRCLHTLTFHRSVLISAPPTLPLISLPPSLPPPLPNSPTLIRPRYPILAYPVLPPSHPHAFSFVPSFPDSLLLFIPVLLVSCTLTLPYLPTFLSTRTDTLTHVHTPTPAFYCALFNACIPALTCHSPSPHPHPLFLAHSPIFIHVPSPFGAHLLRCDLSDPHIPTLAGGRDIGC